MWWLVFLNDRSAQNDRLDVYLNPALQVASILYQVPSKSKVSLVLYDISGRLVRTIYSGVQEKGEYEVNVGATLAVAQNNGQSRDKSGCLYQRAFILLDWKQVSSRQLVS